MRGRHGGALGAFLAECDASGRAVRDGGGNNVRALMALLFRLTCVAWFGPLRTLEDQGP